MPLSLLDARSAAPGIRTTFQRSFTMRKPSSSRSADSASSRSNVAEDVMLYAFLLSADPGGCSPEALAERFLDRKLNAAAEQQAEATLAVAEMLRPQIDAAGASSVSIAKLICRSRRCWPRWR